MPAHSRTVLIRLMRQAEQVNPLIARPTARRSLRPWVNRCQPAAELPMIRQANVLAVAFQRRRRRLDPAEGNGRWLHKVKDRGQGMAT